MHVTYANSIKRERYKVCNQGGYARSSVSSLALSFVLCFSTAIAPVVDANELVGNNSMGTETSQNLFSAGDSPSVPTKIRSGDATGITSDGVLKAYRLTRREREQILKLHGSAAPEESEGKSAPYETGTQAPTAENIKGTDNRRRVRNTTVYPWSPVGFISFKTRQGSHMCTGTLIGPRHVLTAGHCIHDVDTNAWVTSLTFTPGRNGYYTPYGSYRSTKAIVPDKWFHQHNRNFDYGLVVLDSNIGNTTGWYGVRYAPDSVFYGFTLNLAAYSSDSNKTMLYTACVPNQLTSTFVYTQCDNMPGSSGGAMFTFYNSSPVVYAVNAYSIEGPYNGAVRIRPAVYAQLLSLMRANP